MESNVIKLDIYTISFKSRRYRVINHPLNKEGEKKKVDPLKGPHDELNFG